MRVVLGLTGSIGMGKSTTAAMFRDAGVPVWDADAAVHALYAPGGDGVAPIARLHPAALRDGGIDRDALRAWIAQDPQALRAIEAVIHPLVARQRAQFLTDTHSAPLVVLDIPLLFETGADAACDATLVVSAPPDVQRARVMARPGMTDAHFAAIMQKQMPDVEKRRRASHVIETLTPDQTRTEVQALIQALVAGSPDA